MIPTAFVPITGGWFTMGTERGLEDERPPHRVFVDAFELGADIEGRNGRRRRAASIRVGSRTVGSVVMHRGPRPYPTTRYAATGSVSPESA